MRRVDEVDRVVFNKIHREIAARSANGVVNLAMLPQVRDLHVIVIVTLDVGKNLEVMVPMWKSFPQLLLNVPGGHA